MTHQFRWVHNKIEDSNRTRRARMNDIPRMESRYNSRCRCGCRKIIRRGDVIGHLTFSESSFNAPLSVGWVRMECAGELITISRYKDPYVRHRAINARRGIEPDILHPEVTKDEPFISDWLEEDLLCEDVVCPGLG